MNKKIKTKWVKALRSGQYDQTQGYLCEISKKGDSFCCLGVLCDIYAREDKDRPGFVLPIEEDDWKEGESADEYATYLGSDTSLTQEVLDWAGIDECGVHLDKLITLNDDGSSEDEYDKHGEFVKIIEIEGNFEDIADYIQKNM